MVDGVSVEEEPRDKSPWNCGRTSDFWILTCGNILVSSRQETREEKRWQTDRKQSAGRVNTQSRIISATGRIFYLSAASLTWRINLKDDGQRVQQQKVTLYRISNLSAENFGVTAVENDSPWRSQLLTRLLMMHQRPIRPQTKEPRVWFVATKLRANWKVFFVPFFTYIYMTSRNQLAAETVFLKCRHLISPFSHRFRRLFTTITV